MAVYKYVGRTSKGKMKKGTVEAESKQQAITKLREQGISPREINEAKGLLYKEVTIGSPVKTQDFVIYCRQFATLIRAGVSIVQSTQILAMQSESKALKRILSSIESDLRTGISFSDAAAKHPKIFPPIFINMVRAGEATGNLDDTLDRLAKYLENQFDLKKKIQSTMAYPVVLLAIMVLVVIFLMVSIVPTFTAMFAQMGADLPGITLFMIGLSKGIQKWWWLGLLLIIALIIAFRFFMKNNQNFNYTVHALLLKSPIFGNLLQKEAIARMSRTLSSLVSSSVPILQSLDIVAKVVGNPVLSKVILEARSALETGRRLSDPFSKSWLIPPLVTQMLAIGEETGSLDFMLEKIADFYEAEVNRTVDTLKSLIEPIMIVLLAGIIGTVVMSIIIPMFSIFQQV